MRFALLLILIICKVEGDGVLATGKVGTNQERPVVRSIKLNQEYLFPSNMKVGGDNCFGNSLIEVSNDQILRVEANREFILYLTTEFSESYYNLQQMYGEFFEDITMNSLLLSNQQLGNGPELHTVQLPITLNCQYNAHPYFRLKAFLSVKFYH